MARCRAPSSRVTYSDMASTVTGVWTHYSEDHPDVPNLPAVCDLILSCGHLYRVALEDEQSFSFLGGEMKICASCEAGDPLISPFRSHDRLSAEISSLRLQLANARGHNGANVNRGTHPVHPHYGPCDGFTNGGACSICLNVIRSLEALLDMANDENDGTVVSFAQTFKEHRSWRERL
jgi:hypothetical protein